MSSINKFFPLLYYWERWLS